MDAVRSKRFGYIDAGSAQIAMIMYDTQVESLDGLSSVVSTNPEFGTADSNHISSELQQHLENGTASEEHPITQIIADMDTTDTTEKFIHNATESVDVT